MYADLTMSPPDTTSAVTVEPFNQGCKCLHKGGVIDFGPVLKSVYMYMYVIGGMGLGQIYMPQGNDDAGCKLQNAHII